VTLTSSQSAKFARRLDAQEKEVRDKIRESLPQLADEKYIELAGTVYDLGDEALASMLDEFQFTLLERYLRELRRIETARVRLADGEINSCVECGGEIGYRRLDVYPVATRCIHCQTLHEQKYPGQLGPAL
jgi:DnaK suppressor protein